MRMIPITFQKKFLLKANGPFWAQKWHILITLDPLQEFFKILQNEKCQEVDESNNNGLYQEFCSKQMGHFGPEKGTSS